MIWKYHVPPLVIEQGLCDFDNLLESSRVQKNSEKYPKIGKSWHRGIRPIIRVFPFDL